MEEEVVEDDLLHSEAESLLSLEEFLALRVADAHDVVGESVTQIFAEVHKNITEE